MEHNTDFHVILNFPIDDVWEMLGDKVYVDKLFAEQGMERIVLSDCLTIKEEGFKFEMMRQGSVVSSNEIIEIIDEEDEKQVTERMYNMTTKMTTINKYTYRPIRSSDETLIVSEFSLVSENEWVAENYIEMVSNLARFMFVSLENELERKSSLVKAHESCELKLSFAKAVNILEKPSNMKKLNLIDFAEEEKPGQWTIKGIDEKAKRVVQIDKIYEEDEFLLKLVFLNSFGKVEETAQVEVFDMDENILISFESEISSQLEAKTSTRISAFFESFVEIPEDEEKMKIVNSLGLSSVHA